MKNNKEFFFVFIATIVVGALISMNFNFEGIQSYSQLNATQYQDAIEERAALYKKIGNLKEDNNEMRNKINQYTKNDMKNDNILEDMKEQINDYGMFTGLNEVTGPGIVLKVNDGVININEESSYETMNKILHDSDMALIINELRKAGAEAISVNNHRIVPWSAVICSWAFIQFDDGAMESAPFNIYAIGDPEKLKAALLDEGSHIKELIIRKLQVEIREIDNITMPASRSNGNIKYMERYEKGK